MTLTPELVALYAGNTAQRAIETLELSHPEWAQSFWFVNDIRDWRFQLETGTLRDFVALPFELQLPSKNTGGSQELAISICNIGREIMDQLEIAIEDPQPISCTLRIFLDIADSPPQNSPPLVLAISEISATPATVTATATRYDVVNRGFPSRFYRTDEFPGLRR